MTLTPIEEREIRGLTGRLFKGIIWQTVVVVGIVMGTYFKVEAKIDKLYTLREENEKLWQLKFDQITNQNKIFQTQFDGFQMQNQGFQKQLDIIQIRLDELKK